MAENAEAEKTQAHTTINSPSVPPGRDGGMLGPPGTEPATEDPESRHTAPVGVPTDPGADSPTHTEAIPHAASTASVPTTRDVLGTTGNVGHSLQNAEPGTPGIPGTPTPDPAGGQLMSHDLPGTPGPQNATTENMGLGTTPTPGPSEP